MSNRAYALGGLLIGAILGFLAGTQPWWRATGEGLNVAFSGNSSTGGASQALALVAGAGAVLLLTLGVRGRQVVGIMLVLVGLGVLALGALRVRPTAEAVREQIRTVSLTDSFSLSATAWPVVYAGAGVVITVAAAITVWRSPRWPSAQNRFERRSRGVNASLGEHPAEAWKAMDAGVDPTLDADGAPERRGDPDVHSGSPHDTMAEDSHGSTKPSSEHQRSAE